MVEIRRVPPATKLQYQPDDPTGTFQTVFRTDNPGNYGDWETLQKLVESPNFQGGIWGPLIKAKPKKGESSCRYESACGLLFIACRPIQHFVESLDPAGARQGEMDKDLKGIKNRIGSFLSVLEAIPIDHLQRRADEKTDFANTGHMLNVKNLVRRVHGDLKFLTEIIDLPNPPAVFFQPRKRGAKRFRSTARAKLLKNYIEQTYSDSKLVSVVAEIVTVLDELDPPYTADDVSKA